MSCPDLFQLHKQGDTECYKKLTQPAKWSSGHIYEKTVCNSIFTDHAIKMA